MSSWAVLVGVFFALPLVYLVVRTAGFGSDFFETLGNRDTWSALSNSLKLGLSVSAATAFLGGGLAWLTTNSNMAGRRIIGILAPLPLVFPSFVGATALVAGFAKGGLLDKLLSPLGVDSLPEIRGFWAAWIVLSLFTYPYVYMVTRAKLLTLSSSQQENARLLGKKPLEVIRGVVLPQVFPAVSAGALLVFLYTISDFGAVSILRYTTLTRSIYSNRLLDQAASISQALLLGIIALLVVAFERTVSSRVRGESLTEERSGPPLIYSLGKWRWAATALSTGFLLVALASPIAVMGYWVGRGWLSDNRSGALALKLDGLWDPVMNTITVSIIAGLVAVAVLLPLARLRVRHRSKISTISGGLVVSGFAVPGLVISLAMVFWVIESPFSSWLYQSMPLLIAAYVLHSGAQVVGSSEAAVSSFPTGMEEAARSLGAGKFRRFLTIELPLMSPGLLTAAGLVVITTMKELPITLLLSPPDFQTLSTKIWSAWEDFSLAQAGLVSLLLVAISGVLSWFLIFRQEAYRS